MFLFLMSIWIADYFIQMDTQRHKQGLLETKQFAVQITKIPKLNDNYDLNLMKADLWNHVVERIKAYDQQFKDDDEIHTHEQEIIDIQFAMDSYQYLDAVKDILESSKRIEEIDIETEFLKGKDHLTEYDFLL